MLKKWYIIDFNATVSNNKALLNVKQKYNELIINKNGEVGIVFCCQKET